jgi:caa(3)-type oxidase subunit IV
MGTNTHQTDAATYEREKKGYYNVLIGLLVLTAITFAQPHYFLTSVTFEAQLFIGAVKAWLIVVYYMHLKGEKLIGTTVVFALFLVAFFFIIVMIDVNHFQFGDVSHITSETTSAGTSVSARHH